MPDPAPRRCRGHPHCPNTPTRRGLCPPCAKAENQRHRRNTTGANIYRTARWQRLRNRYLLDNPYCQWTRTPCRRPATDLDHITPLELGGPPWDEDNLQGLCKHHHGVKTAEELRARGLGR